jgi:hypothetical protein
MAAIPTWYNLDVGCRVHRHHLGVYTNPIFPEGIEAIGNLYERKWRMNIGIKIVFDGVWAVVDIQWIG